MVFSRKERLALQHLGKNAARAPDVDLDIILLPCEHDLGGAIVPRRNVAGHLGVLDTRQTKVADLEVAVLVDQDVTWFEVPMDDPGRVNILEASLKQG